MADVTVVAAAVRAVAGDPEDVVTGNAKSGWTPTVGELASVSGNDELAQCAAAESGGLAEAIGIVESVKAYRTNAGAAGYRVTARFGGIMEGFTGLTAGQILYNSRNAGKISNTDPTDAVVDPPGLAIGTAPEKYKTTKQTSVLINGVVYSKAATDALTFGTAYTINVGTTAGLFWGVFLIQMNSAGTCTAKAPSADQVYTTEALAIAALPDADDDKVGIGYITVQAKTGASWTADTDDMTPASDCNAVNFYNSPNAGAVGKKIGMALNATQVLLAMPSL